MSTPLIEAIASSITGAKVAFRRTNDARLAKHGLWPNPAAEPPVNDLAQAALTAITEAGMVIVPREPTKAMVKAAADQVTYDIDSEQAVKFITPYAADTAYRTMISAAQRGEPKP